MLVLLLMCHSCLALSLVKSLPPRTTQIGHHKIQLLLCGLSCRPIDLCTGVEKVHAEQRFRCHQVQGVLRRLSGSAVRGADARRYRDCPTGAVQKSRFSCFPNPPLRDKPRPLRTSFAYVALGGLDRLFLFPATILPFAPAVQPPCGGRQ